MFLIRFLILLALAAATWGDEGTIADCLNVVGKLERLVCYDERARDYRREHGVDVTTPAETPSSQAPKTAAVVPIQTDRAVVATTDEPPPPKAEPNEENFRKSELISEPKKLATRIESIIKAPLGNYVMTLSNGQIWSENEPNPRRIKVGQNVTITKKRLYYEMRLESGRSVRVRRIDTD